MSTSDWFAIAIILLCLLLSAAFAGSETALTASSRATMLQLAKQGDRRAAIVNRLLARPSDPTKGSAEEIASLVAQRHLAEDTHHCPHGRPTSLLFSRQELDRQFRRT